MLPFIAAWKPFFTAEYTYMDVDLDAARAWGYQHDISFILNNHILTAFRVKCP